MLCLSRFDISSSGLGDEFRRKRKLMAMEVFKFRAGRSLDLDAVERSELWAAEAWQLNERFEARFTVNGQSFRFSDALTGLEPLLTETAEIDEQLLAEVLALPNAELLLKAIGIARLEPRCRRVVYADWAMGDPEVAIIHIELPPAPPDA